MPTPDPDWETQSLSPDFNIGTGCESIHVTWHDRADNSSKYNLWPYRTKSVWRIRSSDNAEYGGTVKHRSVERSQPRGEKEREKTRNTYWDVDTCRYYPCFDEYEKTIQFSSKVSCFSVLDGSISPLLSAIWLRIRCCHTRGPTEGVARARPLLMTAYRSWKSTHHTVYWILTAMRHLNHLKLICLT